MRMLTPMVLALGLAAAAVPACAKPPEPTETGEDGGLGRLAHATPKTVRDRLGDPDVARAEGKGAFWTYRLPHCALYLFFHDGPKGLLVSGAATGPRRRGEPTPSVAECLASALQLPDAENAH